MSEKSLPQIFSRNPLVWLAAYFVSGIVVRHFFDTGLVIPLGIALGFGLLTFLKRTTSSIAIPVMFASLGILALQFEMSGIATDRIRSIYDGGLIESGEPVEIEGTLTQSPEPAYQGAFLSISTESVRFKGEERNATGQVRLFISLSGPSDDEFERLDIRYRSRIRAYCRLEREEEFQNPGVPSRIAMLDSQGIDAKATIKSSLLIENLGDDRSVTPLAWIFSRRQKLIDDFTDRFSPPTAGVLIASLLGDKHFLDGRTAEVFRDGGTFHVLVISGLHITFIGGIVVWFVSLFSRRRSVQFAIATIFLWAYTFAVGAEVPVVRASLMFTVLFFSFVFERRGSQLNALGACVLILLVWRPSDLFTPSFQLTVVSVGAIVACAFPIIEKLREIGRWMPSAEQPFPPIASKRLRRFCELLYWNEAVWKIENARQIWSANLFKRPVVKILMSPNIQSLTAHLFEGALISLIIQIWMLPLVVIYFHRFSVASVFLNLWVGVFLAGESFAGVFAVLLSYISTWLATPLIVLTEFFNQAMMVVPAWISENDLAGFRLPVYSGFAQIIYVLYAIAVVFIAWQIIGWRPFEIGGSSLSFVRTVVSATAVLILATIIILHPFSSPAPDGRLRVQFLDVGQGDSALVVFPGGETMLVDGGGRPSYRDSDENFSPDVPRIGEAVVSEFLWELGYSRIDYVVATHADADHMQGLSDVAKNFDVGIVMIGGTSDGDTEYDELIRVVEKKGIALTTVRRGDELSISGATVRVLGPLDGIDNDSQNNSSVVLKLGFGSRSFLLTGDIERAAEIKLATETCEDIRSDVVKVPHHGSRTSSTERFVNCVKPATAVISVGRRSQFGHPHKEVVKRWQESGARIIQTGIVGTVSVTTDGDEMEIQTYVR